MSIIVVLDRGATSFFPGETISGCLNVTLREAKQIKRMAVEIEGVENCSWNATKKVPKDGEIKEVTIACSGNRNLFKHRQVLLEGQGKHELPAGRHSSHFQYKLPLQLPYDMEGKHGSIRYFVKGKVEVPWGMDLSYTLPFNVDPLLDLNTLPIAKRTLYFEEEKNVGLLCCVSGIINFTLTAPKMGYVPSETIPFNIQIENDSRAEVYETEIKIKKIITYTSTELPLEKTSEDSILVSSHWPTLVSPGSPPYSLNAHLNLQPTTPTTAGELIQIMYMVEISCKISGLHANITGEIPIIIGTVPLRGEWTGDSGGQWGVGISIEQPVPSAPPAMIFQ